MLKLKFITIILAVSLLTGCSRETEHNHSTLAGEIIMQHYALDYTTHDTLVSDADIEQLSYFTVKACTPYLICVPQENNSDKELSTCWGFVDIDGETEYGVFKKTVYIQFDTDKDETILRNVKVGEVCDFFESFPGGAR